MSAAAKCAVCGGPQAGRCAGGWIEYLASDEPCYRNPDKSLTARPNPDYVPLAAALAVTVAPLPFDNEWEWKPEPSADGLEDLL